MFIRVVMAMLAAALVLGGPRVEAQEAFPVVASGRPAPIWADENDFPGALRAIQDLQEDLSAVSGARARLSMAGRPRGDAIIIVGTIGRSAVIDELIREGKLDVMGVAGQWEGFVQQVVDEPKWGVERALVIAGADMRGTIFGVYDFAEQIGVSPWAWWADVPVEQRSDVGFALGRNVERPGVRYRGIFLNDEEPALGNWARANYGGFNHQFYERVFELILRLKGNYIWPAMWGKSIYDDDPQSAGLADEMGVVVGMSHHEPMMRAHVEWERHGEGAWDYTQNEERLRAFWREGVERMGDNESIVTIGMRGDGDEPMSEDTAIALLERIVTDQRAILAEATGRPAAETPQIWALYKEVQAYYDQGMEVPDDVTLLFADDNWGNIRRLPARGATRPGGYGVYYHFDYVGGPRSYRWINTNQIERVWEQMSLAREYGADRVWIVNVGDLKPMEFPIDFFLDFAWNPEAYPPERLHTYAREWASQQFGPTHGAEIGELLTRYTQYNARRKPELLDADTYSLLDYGEADRVIAQWRDLEERAERVGAALPERYQSAYFQLVLHPILASANLNEMYVALATHRMFVSWDAPGLANALAAQVEARYARDAEITERYHALSGGKWNHFMDQSHIGYRSWAAPDTNIAPELAMMEVGEEPIMGVGVEGAQSLAGRVGRLSFMRYGDQRRTVAVINRGGGAFTYSLRVNAPWVQVSPEPNAPALGYEVELAELFDVSVDWARAPAGISRAEMEIEGAGRVQRVSLVIDNRGPEAPSRAFVEGDGYVAIEAAHFARAINSDGLRWREIPNLSRTGSGVSLFPRTYSAQSPGEAASPRLEYDIWLHEAGRVDIDVTLAPTMPFNGEGLRYAISVDGEAPRIVNVHQSPDGALAHSGEHDAQWESWVADNAIVATSSHRVREAGAHVVKVWAVDPAMVFQRVIVRRGAIPDSYLGPPESMQATRGN